MKIAIAGTNGLAFWIAHYLSTETYHSFILLSRAPKPSLTAKGWQVIVVNYTNSDELQFQLSGVDLVISLVTGPPQIGLIDAAFRASVRRFAPAEFIGSTLRRQPSTPLDRGQREALARLQHYAPQGMAYTILSCGLFYEHFAPGGLAFSNLGQSSGLNAEGDLMMSVRTLRAQIPLALSGQPATVCMTSAQDVGRFVVAALEMPDWPTELRMCGSRMNTLQVVEIAENLMNHPFERAYHNTATLNSAMLFAQTSANVKDQLRYLTLLAIGNGEFDFDDANLNGMVSVVPTPFQEWLQLAWATQFAVM
ncbi:hypothetical protein MMC25_000418 [Agyrium rufum]|nr:hypothetical protein [Agyrium rufum]